MNRCAIRVSGTVTFIDNTIFLVVQVVEQNLLDDLRAAQKYGIEPQEILADLRYRNQMHRCKCTESLLHITIQLL